MKYSYNPQDAIVEDVEPQNRLERISEYLADNNIYFYLGLISTGMLITIGFTESQIGDFLNQNFSQEISEIAKRFKVVPAVIIGIIFMSLQYRSLMKTTLKK